MRTDFTRPISHSLSRTFLPQTAQGRSFSLLQAAYRFLRSRNGVAYFAAWFAAWRKPCCHTSIAEDWGVFCRWRGSEVEMQRLQWAFAEGIPFNDSPDVCAPFTLPAERLT